MVNNFDRFRTVFNTTCNNSMNLVGMFLNGKMRLETPVDTGRLKGSLDFTVTQLAKQWILTLGTNVFYALFVHEGTRRMRPRRYMYDPTIRNAGMIAQIIVNEFRRVFP